MTNTLTTRRLHITPLNSALLDSILAPSVRSAATDISFHTIETFPENNYGFATLPIADADKIMKKLNGAILKGKKLKVQEARPSKRQLPEDETPLSSSSPETESVPKKRKRDTNAIDGFELPSERHIKRGWTEPASQAKRNRKSEKKDEKSKSQKSKYTENAECLFRTNPPPNRAEMKKPSKQKAKSQVGVVVHEFQNSVKHPSFIRTADDPSDAHLTCQYVEGKGWVDQEGNVKEPVPETRATKRNEPRQTPSTSKTTESHKINQDTDMNLASADEDETSSSGSSMSSSVSSDEESSSESISDEDDASTVSSSSEDSSSSSSDEEEEEENEEEEPDRGVPKESNDQSDNSKLNPILATPNGKGLKSSNRPNLGSLPTDARASPSNEVHPLEALFKRPASTPSSTKPTLGINTGFSFFGGNDDIEEEDNNVAANPVEPHTPFTKHDLQARNMRSAAPTPDTAAPTRFKFFDNESDNEDSNSQELLEEDTHDNNYLVDFSDKSKRPANGTENHIETDFAKWFWENRGDNNRAWKRRRREAAKEKRQRENRQRGLRGR